MTDLNVPNTFSSGASIASADMNANFDAIETMVNATGVPVVQDGAVATTAKLADGIVTTAKLAARPVCLIQKSGTQAVTGTVQITGFTTTINTGGDHDNTANAVTIQTGGLYRVTGNIATETSASTGSILKNGVGLIDAGGTYPQVFSLAPGDALTLWYSGDARTVEVARTWLCVEYIGAAS